MYYLPHYYDKNPDKGVYFGSQLQSGVCHCGKDMTSRT